MKTKKIVKYYKKSQLIKFNGIIFYKAGTTTIANLIYNDFKTNFNKYIAYYDNINKNN